MEILQIKIDLFFFSVLRLIQYELHILVSFKEIKQVNV